MNQNNNNPTKIQNKTFILFRHKKEKKLHIEQNQYTIQAWGSRKQCKLDCCMFTSFIWEQNNYRQGT